MKLRRSPFAALLALASPIFLAGCSDRTGHSTTPNPDAGRTSAALVGTEGDVMVAAPAAVNAYAVLASDVTAGSTTLALVAGGAARFNAGDLALVIQAQGADINTTDDATYGSVTDYHNAGRYELIHVTASNVAGNTLTVAAPGLRSGYTAAGRTQVVRVPQYRNLTVSAAGRISAPAWDGTSGGVVALHVRDTLTVDGRVDVSGLGFRGGAVRTTTDNSILNIALYRTDMPINGGEKGESIVGFGAAYDARNGRYGRGAPANAGGGGNAHNAGGGGGANVAGVGVWTGQGVMDLSVLGGASAWPRDPRYIANGNAPTQSPGGGRGGYSYSNSDQDALMLGPDQDAWLGDSRRERGGLGGRPLSVDPLQRLFFGGGGGAGDANNAHGGSGGAGAGIVIIIAHRITGAGQILAQGALGGGAATAPNDAPGGGGGGGTILLLAEQIDGVSVAAPGGGGGTQQQAQNVAETEGPGGGGGGGLVAFHGGLASANVAGAAAGTTNAPALAEFPTNGATRGQSGVSTAVADAWGGVINLPGDLSVSVTNGSSTLAPGALTSYTISVGNAGPNQIPRATLAAITGGTVSLGNVSWTCSAGASSACAAPSGTGLPGGTFDIAPNDTVTFTVTGTVNPAATNGTLTFTATAAVPTGYDDPTTGNDSATDSDAVAPSADLAATISALPPSVITTGEVSLAVNVANGGPSAASTLSTTVTVAGGATLVSATGTGWMCNIAGVVATCTRPSLAAGAGAPLTVVMSTPAVVSVVAATVVATSATTDPTPSNNQANVSVAVTENHVPVTTNDAFMVPANSVANLLDVLANDSVAPDTGEVLTISAVSAALHGTLTHNGTSLIYTPMIGFAGVDMANYIVNDGHGGTATGMVTITVVGSGAGGAGGAGMGGAGGNSGLGGGSSLGGAGGNATGGGPIGGAEAGGAGGTGNNGAAGNGGSAETGGTGNGGTGNGGGSGVEGGANGVGGAGAGGNGNGGNAGNGPGGNGAAGGAAGSGNAGGVAGAGVGGAAGAGAAGAAGNNGGGGRGGAAAGGQGGLGGGNLAGGAGGDSNLGGNGGQGPMGGATGVAGAGALGGDGPGGAPGSGGEGEGGAGGIGNLDVDNDGLIDDGISVRGGGCSCETSGPGAPTSFALTLGMGLVLFARRRRTTARASRKTDSPTQDARDVTTSNLAARGSRRNTSLRVRNVLSLLVTLASLLAAHPGAAQTAQPNTSIPIERFRWSMDRQGLLNVEWGRTPDAGTFSLGLWGNYANDPLVITRPSDGARLGSLVHHRVDGALLASFAVLDRLQLGVVVPLIAYQKGQQDIPGATASTLPKLASIGLGDIIIMPKIGLVRSGSGRDRTGGDSDGFSLALIPTFGIPSSQGKDYFGEKGIWARPELAASVAAGGFRVAANAGYHWHKNHPRLGDLEVKDEVFGLLGLGYRFGLSEDSRRRPFELDLTAAGASSTAKLFYGRNRNPVEADAALQIDLVESFTFMLGGGVGLLPGYGDPDYRLFAGLRLNIFPAAPPVDDDPDKDGVRGAADRCPTEPEDKDRFEDRDGCPDPDNDRDGTLDTKDKCPNVRGPKENQGCPDNDRDDDGLVDRLDQCPDEPEDKDDFEDEDGCPDPDNDKDKVPDVKDKCPNESGPKENQGCPDKDRDGDGIIDRLDNCPDEAGDIANNGCKKKQLARITEHGIEILDTVYFKTDKAVIEKKSFLLLSNVAAVILAHPEAGTIRVEGHTDSQGDDQHNQELSEKRAAAVVEYLVQRQVARERLVARGYGETQPIAENKTRSGRSKNRRVVFVLERAP